MQIIGNKGVVCCKLFSWKPASNRHSWDDMQSDLYAHQESELQIWKRKFISTVFPGPKENFSLDFICNMTFEESSGVQTSDRMDAVGKALEEVLSAALPQGCITVGVYEAAKSLNADPDNVVLCLLATDEGDDRDVALQIHFTLIRAFCCENDINILRVKNMRRLAEILGGGKQGGEPMDMHCVLVTNPYPSTSGNDPTALRKVNYFCRESRSQDQWVPAINLPER